MDNCIDKTDMLSYDGLTHAFNELHKDMTSICLKYKALKVKAFFFKKRN